MSRHSSETLAPARASTEAAPEHIEQDATSNATNAQKRGNLHGGALTEEALDSSRKVLSSHRGNTNVLVGLQQYFTPPEAAELIAAVFGGGAGFATPEAVLDPTAGSGSLLAPFSPERRYGIEIDADFTGSDDYHAITGDAQKVVPMMRAAGLRFPAIALNPPFGLSWRDPAHAPKGNPKGEIGSTRLAYLWALDLVTPYGQGAMVCGTDRLAREVLSTEQGRGIYAVVDVEGPLFDGVDLATSIAFFVRPENSIEEPESGFRPLRLGAPRGGLADVAGRVAGARDRAAGSVSAYASGGYLSESWRTVAKEHSRRRRQAEEKSASERGRFDARIKGSKLGVSPSAFSRLALTEAGTLRQIELLHGQNVSYLGQNKRAWRQMLQAEEAGHLTIDPALKERAEAVIAEADRAATPLFEVRPQMRLGWLTDLEKIPCIKDDPERGFAAGEEYPLSTNSKVSSHTEQRVVESRDGEPELRRFDIERKLLEVKIGEHSFDEGEQSISYIAEHFELPDPGSVATRFPEQVRDNRELLKHIARKNGFKLKLFQLDHLSRLLVKGRGMLAHEQGLGKTPMQMCIAEAQIRLGANPQALFVIPQDLVRQWQKAARGFFNRRFEIISNPSQARDVAKRVEAGERGWWLTYFEALSIVGRKKEVLPEQFIDHRAALAKRLSGYKRSKGSPTTVPEILAVDNRATTDDAWPSCGADTSYGWNKETCEECGYVHRSRYAKTAASHLTTAFKHGVKCVDEVSEIRGDDSLRSKAIRALARGPHNFGATGTPVSNFCNDIYWSLWFCLGNASAQFPYDYEGGKVKFESDFCVLEYMRGSEEKGEGHLRQRKKVLPQVTNVSQLWRLLQPGVSRCRKEQTGERLVQRTYYPIRVPLGASQKRQHEFWLKNFEDYFEYKFPEHSLVKNGLVEKYAAALGQLWRLETAATLPASDLPSREWPKAREELGELSNWTPANLKTLELAIEHVQRGEKVLIGSDLVLTGEWLARKLREKGIKAVHITEEKADGKVGTKNPRKRAREVEEFVSGEAQVLCVGVGAMKLGHDLQVASTVIVNGLHYSHMVQEQFLARVHRLTSERPVSVYVVLPKGSLAETKWGLLRNKGAAADLAIDGELSVAPEEPIDWSKVLEDMKERGIRADVTGAEHEQVVLEADVEAAWERVAPLAGPSRAEPAAPGPVSPTAPARKSPDSVPSLFDLFTEEDAGSHTETFVGQSPPFEGLAEQLALFGADEPPDQEASAA